VKGWKVQKFFGDLVYDLRSRNLLPVVLMLAVGMIAVPILISRSGSGSSQVALTGPAAVSSAPETQNAVVAYHPGIRNLKQRLNHFGPKNPFIQQYTSSPSGSSPASGTSTPLDSVSTSTGSTGGSTGSNTDSNTGGGGGGNGGGGSSGGKTKTVYSYYVTDVTIGDGSSAPAAVNNVQQFQFLPTEATPVAVYLGTASAGQQALFLVSKDVTSVGGNGVCFPSADACQLLGLNAGAGADLLYGPDGKTYHLQVTKIKRVNSSKPPA
jgi:hypothetical protein